MGQDLYTHVNPQAGEEAPVILIYSTRSSERLAYTCHFIFNQVLRVNYAITNNRQDFERSPFAAINYSADAIGGIVQIIPHALLFDTGVMVAKPEPVVKNGQLYFFETTPAGTVALPFDLFSAVFYFISRYEEWQPFEKDDHGRFEARASLLFRQGVHLTPVVDAWIMELAGALQQAYPELQLPKRAFRVLSTLDVDNLFAYRAKGLVRTAGAVVKDLVKPDLYNFRKRLKVLSGKEKDPFDVYEEIAVFCNEQQIPLACFFLFRTGTTYDRTVDPASGVFAPIVAGLKHNNAAVGLHPSYEASVRPEVLKEEVSRFSALLGEPVRASRQHYLRFDIKTTPALLLAQGIRMDFTMGFASSPGFRAGTSHPFFYYDFLAEKRTELLFVPFCAMDGAYTVYDRLNADAAYQSLIQLAAETKKVNGLFVTVFHERTFFNHLYPGFGPLYKKLHLALKEI